MEVWNVIPTFSTIQDKWLCTALMPMRGKRTTIFESCVVRMVVVVVLIISNYFFSFSAFRLRIPGQDKGSRYGYLGRNYRDGRRRVMKGLLDSMERLGPETSISNSGYSKRRIQTQRNERQKYLILVHTDTVMAVYHYASSVRMPWFLGFSRLGRFSAPFVNIWLVEKIEIWHPYRIWLLWIHNDDMHALCNVS